MKTDATPNQENRRKIREMARCLVVVYAPYIIKMSRTPARRKCNFRKWKQTVKDNFTKTFFHTLLIIDYSFIKKKGEREKLNQHDFKIETRTLKKLHHNKCRPKTKNCTQSLGIEFAIVKSNKSKALKVTLKLTHIQKSMHEK